MQNQLKGLFLQQFKKMKKLILLAVLAAGFIACNSNKGAEQSVELDNLNAWLDSVSNLENVTVEQWTSIEGEYAMATMSIDTATMDESGKVKYTESVSRWEMMKAANMEKMNAEAAAVSVVMTPEMITEFYGPGIIMANENDYSFMTAENALAIYENFYDRAVFHKDDYTSDQWNLVKAMYEKMDAQKNVVEKEGLKTSDNLKIAKTKAKFVVLFNTNKTEAKIEEKAAN